MKHLIFTLLVAVCSLNITAQNLLTDSGFETGTYNWNPGTDIAIAWDFSSTGWTCVKVARLAVTTNIVTNEFHSGQKSAKIELQPQTGTTFNWYRNIVTQRVPVLLDKTYIVTLWAKGNRDITALFYTRVNESPLTFRYIGNSPTYQTPTNDWAQYTFTLDVAGRTQEADVTSDLARDYTLFCIGMAQVNSPSTSMYTVWVDDIELRAYDITTLSAGAYDHQLSTYIDGKTIYVNNEIPSYISIYGIDGNLILAKQINPEESISLTQLGCYILKVKNAKEELTQKIVIR